MGLRNMTHKMSSAEMILSYHLLPQQIFFTHNWNLSRHWCVVVCFLFVCVLCGLFLLVLVFCFLCCCFFPPVWPIRTRLGPYNCVSSEKQECTRTRVVQKLRQIITKTTTNTQQKTTTTKNDPQIPQPDLRFATKQNSEATRNGAGPKKNQKTHSDLP